MTLRTAPAVVITCEHGGNRIPQPYAALFRDAGPVLGSHRGYDPGSLELAKLFARRLNAPLFASTVSRLLVELNRSTHHRSLFSEFTAGLARRTKQQLLDRYYVPHRLTVEDWINRAIRDKQRVIHLSIHTFTPVLNGVMRTADVGLLYDPCRRLEHRFCLAWQKSLCERRADLRVRRNYPYLGKSDGFTTYLRRRFPDERYAGIELEVNQRWPRDARRVWRQLQSDVVDAVVDLVEPRLNAVKRFGSS